jgi:hypothetical protein
MPLKRTDHPLRWGVTAVIGEVEKRRFAWDR